MSRFQCGRRSEASSGQAWAEVIDTQQNDYSLPVRFTSLEAAREVRDMLNARESCACSCGNADTFIVPMTFRMSFESPIEIAGYHPMCAKCRAEAGINV